MSEKQLLTLERVAKIKQAWLLHDAGVNKYDIAKQTGFTCHMAFQIVSLKWRAKYTRDMHLIENMSNEQLDGAIKNYFDAKLKSDLIDGIKISKFAGMYFVALHLDGKYENHEILRKMAWNRKVRRDFTAQKEVEITVVQDLKEAKQNKGAEFGLFEDDPRIKRAPVISFHGKSSGGGYGCAAAMCAEA